MESFVQFTTNRKFAYKDTTNYPSKKFSDFFSIPVYKEWEVPGARTALNRMMPNLSPYKRRNEKKVESLWAQFVDLNPEIKTWLEDKNNLEDEYTQKWNIMFGMVSMFNEDDIRSYLRGTGLHLTHEFRARIKEVSDKLNIFALGWVPSEKTLSTIEKATENLPKI